jgi:acetyltransferase
MLMSFKKPYPAQYEKLLALKNGKNVFVRPIRDTDGKLLLELFDKLYPDSIYRRFLTPLRMIPENLLFKLTHVNYDSDFALVAVIPENGKDAIIAVARYGYDAREQVTDFAILVRDDWQGLGLGKRLLKDIFAIGRDHGVSCFVSLIDANNHVMKRADQKPGLPGNVFLQNGAAKVQIFV